jgi:hypothetical protein
MQNKKIQFFIYLAKHVNLGVFPQNHARHKRVQIFSNIHDKDMLPKKKPIANQVCHLQQVYAPSQPQYEHVT